MNAERLEELVLSAKSQRILCLGDVMLDHYIYGHVTRISPEAPVPILAHTHDERMPGGAANTARNLTTLGARTRLISVVGADKAGEELQVLLDDIVGIDAHLHIDASRATTRKTRLVSGGQQLLRLDHDSIRPVSQMVETVLLEELSDAFEGATAVLLSDYAKGFVSAEIIAAVLRAGMEHRIPVIVDPKGLDIAKYGPVDLIKPNATELAAMVGLPTITDTDVEAALQEALELSAAKAVLVTRAAKGLSYLERGESVVHLPGTRRDVFDVSGAGDTSLAALGVALSGGASLHEAAELALIASGIAVEKVGTATVTPAEMLSVQASPVVGAAELGKLLGEWRSAGHSIGFTNGCFDILHPGHLRVLEEAKARCGRLIVGLNSDASVRRLKGQSRPVNDEFSRARLLAGLSAVDAVVLFSEDTPLNLIERIAPNLLVKGGDYAEADIVGADLVQARGGQVHIVPLLDGHSTTSTIARAAIGDNET